MLFLPALMMPLLALYAFERLGPQVTALVLLALVILNISHTEPKRYLTFDDEYFYPHSIARNGLNTTTREEYEPRWVRERPAYSPVTLWGADSAVTLTPRTATSETQSFRVVAAKPTRMYDTLFYYPGWTVKLDQRPITISPQPQTGLITFDLPSGTHDVSVELRPTAIRAVARDISLGAAVMLVAMLIAAGLAHLDAVRKRLPVARAHIVPRPSQQRDGDDLIGGSKLHPVKRS
jgi:hypothetical protein